MDTSAAATVKINNVIICPFIFCHLNVDRNKKFKLIAKIINSKEISIRIKLALLSIKPLMPDINKKVVKKIYKINIEVCPIIL
jgi:hypothetical protein